MMSFALAIIGEITGAMQGMTAGKYFWMSVTTVWQQEEMMTSCL